MAGFSAAVVIRVVRTRRLGLRLCVVAASVIPQFSVVSPALAVPVGAPMVTAVAAGSRHSLALRSDGSVLAFGSNDVGQLGVSDNVGTPTPNPAPTVVPGLQGIIAIAAGADDSLALRSDGTVWAFGLNEFGQLGSAANNGTKAPNSVPTMVAGLSDVVAIAAGLSHTLALRSDGTVWAFGFNYFGQLGTTSDNLSGVVAHPIPTQVPGLSNVVAIAAGDRHNLALRSDGTVWAFGHNVFGQLGTDTNNNIYESANPTPTQVAGLSGAVAVAAGGASSWVVRSDGSVWAFGDNYWVYWASRAPSRFLRIRPRHRFLV